MIFHVFIPNYEILNNIFKQKTKYSFSQLHDVYWFQNDLMHVKLMG